MTRSALVTGAARGIGLAVAERLVSDGWSVMASDIDDGVHARASVLAGSARPGVQVRSRRCDVGVEADVDALVSAAVSEMGPLHLVVVNAGIGGGSTEVADTPASEFDAVVDVNLRGAFLTVRAAARVLRSEGRGSIVVIGSMYGRAPVPGAVAYSASKAAVVSIVKTAALELGPCGVRVNAVAPGYIDTAMRRDALQYRADRLGVLVEQLYAADVAAVPLRRYGTGADVAATVAFLAGDDAAYVTGQVIDVTGGVSL